MPRPIVGPTLADRVVSWFAPVAGARRMRARAFAAAMGGYTGASRSRRSMSAWQAPAQSADAALLPDLPTLRDRSRDLIRNAPLAGGAIANVVTHTVGTGLMLRARIDREILGMSEDDAARWQRTVEREWRMWCESVECDITRTQTFYQLQDLAFRSALEAGDCFVLLPMLERAPLPYRTRVQLIEGDRVSNPRGQRDRPEFSGGIERDAFGAPVWCHIARQHPGAVGGVTPAEWDRVRFYGETTGRRNILHLFERRRPEQTRGVPYLAPVIESFKQLDRYSESELMAAVVNALFTVFIETDGEGLDQTDPRGMGAETGAKTSDTDVKLGSGAIIDLQPGEKANFVSPTRPNAQFDPFVTAMLRQIGVALELPYEVLVKHFTASYSAARAALLEAWRFFKGRRDWLATGFCQPVYETWLAEAVALGRVPAPGFFADPLWRHAYCGAMWVGDGPGSIDPLREADAAGRRLELHISTLDQEIAEYSGQDWERVHEQRARERRAQARDGLTGSALAQAPRPQDQEIPRGTDREDQ